MKCTTFALRLVLFLAMVSPSVWAQQSPASTSTAVVPNLISYSGTLTSVSGTQLPSVVGVTFLLYKDQQGGAPLWLETQNVTPDNTGHYTVQLGTTSASGLPSDLFQTGEARWLAVQVVGEAEQPRVLLVAVPYAMKAADAATIGGLPPSAFVLAPSSTANANGTTAPSTATIQQLAAATGPSSSRVRTPTGTTPVTTAGGTVNYLPLWDSASDITNSILFEGNSGTRIGINTTTPGSTLDVNGTGNIRGSFSANSVSASIVAGAGSQPNAEAVYARNTDTTTASYGVVGKTSSSVFPAAGVDGQGPGFGVIGTTSSTVTSPGSGVLGWATASTGSAQGVQGFTSSSTGTGVYGAAVSASNVGQHLMYSSGYPYNGFGFGVWGDTGASFNSPGPIPIAVLGTADQGIAGYFENNGLFDTLSAVTESPYYNAFSTEGPNGYCDIDARGDLYCSGAIVGSSKNFRIDHPFDPANKYLNHSSVESSEMMNIYTGNVTTDAQGDATVQLPDWFEAINGDFRYQLTVIGQFAQAIVAREIQNHEFAIKTNVPNVKVSWQVTGVRQDAWAKGHPLVVEEQKEEKLRGYYIHPELYGAPNERRLDHARHPELLKLSKARQEHQTKPATPTGNPPNVPPPTIQR